MRALAAALATLLACAQALCAGDIIVVGSATISDPREVPVITAGAIANDGVDDRAAFQTVIDATCAGGLPHVVRVPQGIFHFTKGLNYGSLDVNNCQGLTFVGGGQGVSTLKMIGRLTEFAEDWSLFYLYGGSTKIVIRDMTLDGSRADMTGTAEQVHILKANDITGLVVTNVDIIDSFNEGMQLIDADQVLLSNSSMSGHGRGGINLHSNSEDVRIIGNSFVDICDQDIATEGSGGNARLIVMGNTHGPKGDCTALAYDLGLGLVDAVVLGNTIDDGQVQMYYFERGAFIGNALTTTLTSSPVPLALKGRVQHMAVVGNSILSAGTDANIDCITVESQDATRDPHSFILANNICQHSGDTTGIAVSSGLGRFVLSGNVVRNLSATASHGIGLTVSNVLALDQRGISIVGNVITNEAMGVLTSQGVSGGGASQDSITIAGNAVHSAKTSADGFDHSTSNAAPFSSVYPTKCRSDANVLDVPGTTVTNRTANAGDAPTASEGCVLHGDPIP